MRLFGQTFESWVMCNLSDRYGTPRTRTWATNLAHQYRCIAQFRDLARAFEDPAAYPQLRGKKLTLSSAYYTAKMATLENWERQANAAWDKANGKPETPDLLSERARYVRHSLASSLLVSALRPAYRLKEEFNIRRKEVEGEPEGGFQDMDWKFCGGNLDKETRARWESLVGVAYKVAGEQRPKSASFVRDVERVLALMEEAADAGFFDQDKEPTNEDE
jgi:hypothetical protein